MLVCAKCEFDNPDDNRFCQNCGHSLRLATAVITLQAPASALSDVSDPDVSDNAEAMLDDDLLSVDAPRAVETSTMAVAESTDAFPLALVDGQFLDESCRYQLQSAWRQPPRIESEFEIQVTDCQPGDPSPIYVQQTVLLESELSTEAVEKNLLEQVPSLAHPYLQLQNQLFPVLPELYAAWQQDDCTILILENRQHFKALSDNWCQPATESLQQVHWFFEMTDLWSTLAAWQGQGSLLKSENLCVDEDRILCLRRLHAPTAESPYQLADLGLFWANWLKNLPNGLAELTQVADAVASGQISQVKSLQNRLAQIARDLESATDAAEPLNSQSIDHPQAGVFAEKEAVECLDESESSAEAEAEADMAFLAAYANEVLEDSESDALGGKEEQSDGSVSHDEDTEAMPPNLPDIASFLLSSAEEDAPADEEADMAESTMVLPMVLVGLDDAGQTHVGQQRDHNEDSYYIRTDAHREETPTGRKLAAKGVYILCDGMGGHDGGEVASALAVETLQMYLADHWEHDLPSGDVIETAISAANRAIYTINLKNDRSGSGRMGTTLVMVLVQNTRAVVAHVGDSRLYRYSRRLGLEQATVDHEVGQREIRRGVEPAIAYARPDAYQLTQALGPRDSEDIRPSISYLDLSEDTVLLLCSDGLSDNDLIETHCQSHIQPLLRSCNSLEEGVADLIELANSHNGHDNITAIAIRLKVRPNLEKLRR